MKSKREIFVGSALVCAALVISCGDDDDGGPSSPKGGAGGTESTAGSAGKPSAGAPHGGSSQAGTAGKGGSGGEAAGAGGMATAGAAGESGSGGSGGEGGAEPTIDCTKVPTKPLKVEELTGPKAYHDVAFDKNGNLIGNDNEDLLRTALGGKPKVMVPGIGQIQGIDTYPNGDLLVIAISIEENESALVRVNADGGQEKLVPAELGSYGVRIGPGGFIYLAMPDTILRIDPETRKAIIVPSDVDGWAPRVMDYSPDKKRLYVGTLGEGTVYYYDLDEAGKTKGYPKVFAEKVGEGYHDGLGVDACGNVFVADFTSTALYRITPEGEVTLYQDWKPTSDDSSDYGHGLEWGSGLGGYEKTSLYLPQPYDDNTVVRVDVGVPARPR